MSFFAELRRRNVPRAAILYAGVVWALAQGISQLSPAVGVPDWSTRWFLIAAAIGLPFWLAFAWFYEFTPQGFKRESEVAIDAPQRHTNARKLDFAIIGVLAVAVVLLLTDRFVSHKDAATGASVTAAIPEKSIAVLPLSNESGEHDQQYFSDGLSDSLINALSQFAGLKVIGRGSSFQFRDSKLSSAAIGQALGVAHLLEGSVQHAGDMVRISATLVNSVDGSTLWAHQYDRPYKDLFALQDDITQQVADALKARLLANEAAATLSDRPPSGNLDAYAAYLQGNYYAARGSEDDYRHAIAEYATATRIDPRYARAWAASSHAGNWLASSYLSDVPAQQMFAQVKRDADTALRLEPNLAAAHSARCELLSTVDFDWNGAVAECRRALQLEPGNDLARENLGVLYASRGQPEQAIAATRQSLVADPMRASGYFLLSRYLMALGRADEAEQAVRKAIELQPASGQYSARLVEIEVQRDDPKAALDTAQKILPGIWQRYGMAMALQIGGDRAVADVALKQIVEKDANGMAFQIAEVQALRRDATQTFAWLDRAFANRDPGLQYLLVNPFILRFQHDPRFAAFCKKLGVPATTDAQAMP